MIYNEVQRGTELILEGSNKKGRFTVRSFYSPNGIKSWGKEIAERYGSVSKYQKIKKLKYAKEVLEPAAYREVEISRRFKAEENATMDQYKRFREFYNILEERPLTTQEQKQLLEELKMSIKIQDVLRRRAQEWKKVAEFTRAAKADEKNLTHQEEEDQKGKLMESI
jgi:hypothetical protein